MVNMQVLETQLLFSPDEHRGAAPGSVTLTYEAPMTPEEAWLIEREIREAWHTGQMRVEARRRKEARRLEHVGEATDEAMRQELGGDGPHAWFDGARVIHRRIADMSGILEALSPDGSSWAVHDPKKLDAGQAPATIWAGNEAELTADWKLEGRADAAPSYTETSHELAAEEAEMLREALTAATRDLSLMREDLKKERAGHVRSLQEVEQLRWNTSELEKLVREERERRVSAEAEVSRIHREVDRLISRHAKT